MLKQTIIGNLTKDAEWRSTSSGRFLTFDVAVSINNKSQFIQCSMNEKQANAIFSYLSKGTKVYVEGLPSINSYVGKDGNSKFGFKLFVNFLVLLSNKSQTEDNFVLPQSKNEDVIPF